jgi:hypothetical protein
MTRLYTNDRKSQVPAADIIAQRFIDHADIIARDPAVRAIRLARYISSRASTRASAANALRAACRPCKPLPPPPLPRWQRRHLHRRSSVTLEDSPCR